MDSSRTPDLPGGSPFKGWTLKSLGMKKGPWSKVTSGKWERRTMHPAAQLDSSPQQSLGAERAGPTAPLPPAPKARFLFPSWRPQGRSGEDGQGGMETYMVKFDYRTQADMREKGMLGFLSPPFFQKTQDTGFSRSEGAGR